MMLHRMSAYHNRQILCSARLAYSVYYTVGHLDQRLVAPNLEPVGKLYARMSSSPTNVIKSLICMVF